ncbi:MAG: nucleotide sugar dehydrogenase [Planctomycetes bacterium]|nr:nucleotide sugar dehydrogenase [Planctomycetota bacterium]
MRISIFGLGYVGAVSLGCLARDGHHVVGVDIDPTKLDLIRSGQTPVIEAGMQELISGAVRSGRVEVTTDAGAALRATEISFLCVGTPPRQNGSQDLSAMERLCVELGDALRGKEGYHVFVVRSTVMPGTVEGMVRGAIEEHSGKRLGEGFGLCFQPEFMREGSSIKDYDHPPMTVVGGDSPRSVEAVRGIFGHLPCRFHETSIRVAEMLKYFCNIFHALKITFANETGRICQALGVDPHQVMDLLCKDTHLNISTAYLKPGFAFGGSCLPKDLKALTYVAKHKDVDIPMLRGVIASNRAHIDHAVEKVLAQNERRVGMIGLAFKTGTDDLRESPLVTMAERFLGKGIDLKIHDPEVALSRLVGANRRYIEEVIPHIGSLMMESADVLIARSRVVVVGLRTPELTAALQRCLTEDHMVLDLVNLPDKDKLRGRYVGVCW